MSFAEIQTKSFSQNTVKKLEYIQLTPGAHRIRILESEAKSYRTHYINRATVLCLEDDCPICANNKKIIMQFPDTFRDQSGYNRYSTRYFVNVLDRTPAKVCSSCKKEYKNLAATICSCGTVLDSVAPLNKVKILSKGSSLFEDLNNIDKSILTDTGEKIGLTNYDINIIVNGTGRDVKYTPIPDTSKSDVVTVEEGALFDLTRAVIKLTPEEMLDVQRGVSLKDIFAARRSAEKKEESVEVAVPDTVLQDVDDAVKALFQQ